MALIVVPQSGQSLGVTLIPVQSNFGTINTAFQVDHVDYGISNQGMHQQVTFVPNASVPTYAAGNIGLFNQSAVPTSVPDIWLARGVSTPYPMTGTANINSGANGWTYYPSGMILTWGKATTSGGTFVVTFANSGLGGIATFPGFASFLANISALRIEASGSDATTVIVKSVTLTTATFATVNGSANVTFYWSALGI